MSLKDAMQKISEQVRYVDNEREEKAKREQAIKQAANDAAEEQKRIVDEFLKTKLRPAFERIKEQFKIDGLEPDDFIINELVTTPNGIDMTPVIGLVFCMPNDRPDFSKRSPGIRISAGEIPLVWISFAVLRMNGSCAFFYSPNASELVESHRKPVNPNAMRRPVQSKNIIFKNTINVKKLPSMTVDEVDSLLGEMLIYLMDNIEKLRTH